MLRDRVLAESKVALACEVATRRKHTQKPVQELRNNLFVMCIAGSVASALAMMWVAGDNEMLRLFTG